LIIVNSLELSSDDQPIKGYPGSELRAMRRIFPFPAGATLATADPAAVVLPVVTGAVVGFAAAALVEALVAAGFAVLVGAVLPPHAASTAAPALAATAARK
jgi:hypothetical protein